MFGFLRRWRPRQLFAAWAVWWLLLLLRLTPAYIAIWRASQAPPNQGNVGVSFNNGVLSLNVAIAGQTTWTGSISFLWLALLAAGPPLLLWVVWASSRPAPEPERERVP